MLEVDGIAKKIGGMFTVRGAEKAIADKKNKPFQKLTEKKEEKMKIGTFCQLRAAAGHVTRWKRY